MASRTPTVRDNGGSFGTTTPTWTAYDFTGSTTTSSLPSLTAASSASASTTTPCSGANVSFSDNGSGGTATWYTGGCGTTNVGTGTPSIAVASSTTYYVRREASGCNTTCQSVTVTPTIPSTSSPTALVTGDVVWAGQSSSTYNTAGNWLVYNGSTYAMSASAPTTSTHVTVRSNTGCNTNWPHITNANDYANNLTIDPSAQLYIDNTNTVNVNGNFVNNGTLNFWNTGSSNNTGTGIISVNGNFTNAGTMNVGSGKVTMSGTANANLNTGGTTLNNLTVDKSSGDVSLQSAVNVGGTLAFSAGGKIILGGYNLTITSGNAVTGFSTTKYIVADRSSGGTFTINNMAANTTRDFPVGRSTTIYTPITISNPAGGSTTNFGINLCSGPSNANGSNCGGTTSAPSVNNVWHISSSVMPLAQPATITFYWPWSSLNQNSFNPANAAVNHWSNHTGTGFYSWATIGSVNGFGVSSDANNASAIGSVGTGQFYSRQGQYTKFSPFGISSGFALPIELLSFIATPHDNKIVDLKWTTASEVNNDYFSVEKSADGQNFFSVATIKGAGNSSSALQYEITDNTPLKGLSYYKLKQTDFDGKFSYSQVVPVTIASPGSVIVSRNSTSGNYLIDFKASSDQANDYTIEFTNSIGQVIYREILNSFSGSYNREFDFVAEGKGVYLVSITSNTDKMIKRVIAY